MKNILFIIIASVLVVGIITSSSIAYAHVDVCAGSDNSTPFKEVWNAICDLQHQIDSQDTKATALQLRSYLVGEWNFENNVLDSSGQLNAGTLTGGTFVDGKFHRALSFNGISDVVSVQNSNSLNFGKNGSFTISLWMKSTQSGGGEPGYGLLVDHRRNNDGVYQGYSIEDNSGVLIGRIRDDSGNDVAVKSTINVNDGQFHHIVFVVDRSSNKEILYINNSLKATASIASVGSIDSQTNLDLGGMEEPNTLVDFYNGVLDQVRIYDIPLSPSQVSFYS